MGRLPSGLGPAAALFWLAPLIGEFGLGNLRVDQIYVLPVFAPLYGGGALLIRETVRRTGRGWPAIVLLAAAYALLEEGPIDQLLWNPHYSEQATLAGDVLDRRRRCPVVKQVGFEPTTGSDDSSPRLASPRLASPRLACHGAVGTARTPL